MIHVHSLAHTISHPEFTYLSILVIIIQLFLAFDLDQEEKNLIQSNPNFYYGKITIVAL